MSKDLVLQTTSDKIFCKSKKIKQKWTRPENFDI